MERVLVSRCDAIAAGVLLLAAASCSAEPTQSGQSAYAEASGPIAEALASAARSNKDRADDEMRLPGEVLAVLDIKPGMTIFEVEAGEGYYTELFSSLVGPDGHIIMHNSPAFDGFLSAAVNERLEGGRLANVDLRKSPFDEFDAADSEADMVTWMLGPHDLYFSPTGGEAPSDPEAAFAEAFRILKPGGHFYIIDHAAPEGAPPTTGASLHRIDEAIVRDLASEAGFEFAGSSDLLRNPDDPRTESVFNPEIRRRTDRFFLRYTKPSKKDAS